MGLGPFLEALQAEILSGKENLDLWIKRIRAQEGLEVLFELETWLKGLNSFLDVRHLPLTERERMQRINRNFAPEIRIVRRAIQICENHASEIIRLGCLGETDFESYISSQMRSERFSKHPEVLGLDESSPKDSLQKLLDGLGNLKVWTEAHPEVERQNFRAYLSLQKSYRRILTNCRYLNILLGQKFRVEYDRIDNPVLSEMLGSIPDKLLRGKVARALLHLFRCLKYLGLVEHDLRHDRPLRHHLVIFSLIHEEMGNIAEYIKTSFLKGDESDSELSSACELIACSLSMEAGHILERELILVSRDPDASSIFCKIESSHGLLRNCFENCIIALVQACAKKLNARDVFPKRAEGFQIAHRLRQDLWELRQYLKHLLEKQEAPDSSKIIERLSALRDSSMNDLMHGDWVEFERFSDALITSGSTLEIRNQVKKFIGYLEALAQEVSKRSVLQEMSEPKFPKTASPSSPSGRDLKS
jgi:hypothetical protein